MRICAVLLILLAIGLAAYAAWHMFASMKPDPDHPKVDLTRPMYAGLAAVVIAIIAVVLLVMQSWHAIRP